MISLFGWELSMRVRLRRKPLPLPVDGKIRDKVLKTYSQFQEDLLLYQIFDGKRDGVYVDIGANHPVLLNNTKKFYDLGWRGINVEPNPNLHRKFCELRPDDRNLNCGVGDAGGEMTFYEFAPDYYSTFDRKSARRARYSSSRKVIGETKIRVMSINEVFSLHDGVVDFLSVDTEGFDYKVLHGNDWRKNRPSAIVVELNHDACNDIFNLLTGNGYHLVFYNNTNGIFVSTEFSSVK